MIQELLFQTQDLPEGLVYHPDFLSQEEERDLLGMIRQLEFGELRMHGVVARRRIIHYGRRYSFGSQQLSAARPIPEAFHAIREGAARLAGIAPADFAQALVTEYPPGAAIGWHRDAPPFGMIAGVSLAGQCRMRFQRGAGAERRTAALELLPRSLYLLTGSARSEWEHSIPPGDEMRYSITFRTLR